MEFSSNTNTNIDTYRLTYSFTLPHHTPYIYVEINLIIIGMCDSYLPQKTNADENVRATCLESLLYKINVIANIVPVSAVEHCSILIHIEIEI